MKKFLFISLFFLAAVFANAQTYHPLPDSNAVWVYGWYDGNCTPFGFCGYRYYTIHGDTIIGSFSYKKVYGSNDGLSYGFNRGIRQDSIAKKVYVNNLCGIDTLLYDFSQIAGDTLLQCTGITGGGGPIYVSSVDSILIAGAWRKKINPNINASLIEGIGSTGGLFGPWDGWIGGNYALKCFSINGIPVYPATTCDISGISTNTNVPKNDFRVYPNPVEDISTLEFNANIKKTVDVLIYNVLGNLVKTYSNITSNTVILYKKDFNKGLYYIKLNDGDESLATSKFIVN